MVVLLKSAFKIADVSPDQSVCGEFTTAESLLEPFYSFGFLMSATGTSADVFISLVYVSCHL